MRGGGKEARAAGTPSRDSGIRAVTSPGTPTPEARAEIDALKQDPVLLEMARFHRDYYSTHPVPDEVRTDPLLADIEYVQRGGRKGYHLGVVQFALNELLDAWKLC